MRIPEPALSILKQHHVLHLSTARVHSVPLFYAVSDTGLVWISDPKSEHSVDLAVSPEAAASVAPSAPPMDSFSGVQLRGWVDLDADQSELEQCYLRRFPSAAKLVLAAPTHRFFLLRPQWVRRIERAAHKVTRNEWSE